MNLVKAAVPVFLVVFLAGCNSKFTSPSAPSSISSTSSNGLIPVDTPEGQIGWSPYIVVHDDGSAINGYETALKLLKSRGMVRGVRLSIGVNPNRVTQMIKSLDIEVFGSIPNERLFDSNIEQTMDMYISFNPGVQIIQIGNEVSTINKSAGFSNMPIEDYMKAFLKIYDHVQSKYPHLTLVTQSTFGAGSYGADELRKMSELGLKPDRISPQKVVVALNVYTDSALVNYASAINRYLGGKYRIWVTETGISDPARQIYHVGSFYHRLASSLGAERIYWYALWGGNVPPESGYSLIFNPGSSTPTYSPLLKALTGTE